MRVTALDDAMDGETGSDERRQSHADLLIEIAADAELFHTSDMTPYADVTIEGHRETWSVRSRGFRRWLTREFYHRHGGAPSAEAVQAALGVIEAKAHYDAPERPIFLRIGEHAGKLYLDLCDPAWRAVEIDCTGWRVVSDPPCRFRRAAGMLALPEPTRGGSIADLRRFLNVATPADDADGADDPPGFVLAVAWLLAAFRATGPYPVLILAGEHGSAKSTFLLVLRLMIDPNASALRSLPREDRDLFIAANNGHVLSFDNVSGLPAWISDTLCRLATGGGFATRQLYTDQDEVLFDAMRPCALNGIEDVVSRPDLADRGLFLMLYPIAEEQRRAQSELLAEIEAARPAILGALLSAVVHGLQKLPETRLDRLPRMADFALWATACEGGVGWEAGTFMDAYDSNRRTAIADVIDSDPVAAAVRDLMDNPATPRNLAGRTEWTGTAKSLLAALQLQVGDAVAKGKTWPKSPRGLSGRLRRAATFLRASGIEITFGKREGHDRDRTIIITGPENRGEKPSAPSAPSAQPTSSQEFRCLRRARRGRWGGADRPRHSRPSADRPQQLVEKKRCGRCGRCGRKNPRPIGCADGDSAPLLTRLSCDWRRAARPRPCRRVRS